MPPPPEPAQNVPESSVQPLGRSMESDAAPSATAPAVPATGSVAPPLPSAPSSSAGPSSNKAARAPLTPASHPNHQHSLQRPFSHQDQPPHALYQPQHQSHQQQYHPQSQYQIRTNSNDTSGFNGQATAHQHQPSAQYNSPQSPQLQQPLSQNLYHHTQVYHAASQVAQPRPYHSVASPSPDSSSTMPSSEQSRHYQHSDQAQQTAVYHPVRPTYTPVPSSYHPSSGSSSSLYSSFVHRTHADDGSGATHGAPAHSRISSTRFDSPTHQLPDFHRRGGAGRYQQQAPHSSAPPVPQSYYAPTSGQGSSTVQYRSVVSPRLYGGVVSAHPGSALNGGFLPAARSPNQAAPGSAYEVSTPSGAVDVKSLGLPPKKTGTRRRLRACDSCFYRKLRCDALPRDFDSHPMPPTPLPSCSACRKFGEGCTFNRNDSKRGNAPPAHLTSPRRSRTGILGNVSHGQPFSAPHSQPLYHPVGTHATVHQLPPVSSLYPSVPEGDSSNGQIMSFAGSVAAIPGSRSDVDSSKLPSGFVLNDRSKDGGDSPHEPFGSKLNRHAHERPRQESNQGLAELAAAAVSLQPSATPREGMKALPPPKQSSDPTSAVQPPYSPSHNSKRQRDDEATSSQREAKRIHVAYGTDFGSLSGASGTDTMPLPFTHPEPVALNSTASPSPSTVTLPDDDHSDPHTIRNQSPSAASSSTESSSSALQHRRGMMNISSILNNGGPRLADWAGPAERLRTSSTETRPMQDGASGSRPGETTRLSMQAPSIADNPDKRPISTPVLQLSGPESFGNGIHQHRLLHNETPLNFSSVDALAADPYSNARVLSAIPRDALEDLIHIHFQKKIMGVELLHRPTWVKFWDRQPPILQNAIFALNARFSQHPAILALGRGATTKRLSAKKVSVSDSDAKLTADERLEDGPHDAEYVEVPDPWAQGEPFFQRARLLMLESMDSPSVESVVALLMMRIYCNARNIGGSARSILLLNMAARQAEMIALHVDLSELKLLSHSSQIPMKDVYESFESTAPDSKARVKESLTATEMSECEQEFRRRAAFSLWVTLRTTGTDHLPFSDVGWQFTPRSQAAKVEIGPAMIFDRSPVFPRMSDGEYDALSPSAKSRRPAACDVWSNQAQGGAARTPSSAEDASMMEPSSYDDEDYAAPYLWVCTDPKNRPLHLPRTVHYTYVFIVALASDAIRVTSTVCYTLPHDRGYILPLTEAGKSSSRPFIPDISDRKIAQLKALEESTETALGFLRAERRTVEIVSSEAREVELPNSLPPLASPAMQCPTEESCSVPPPNELSPTVEAKGLSHIQPSIAFFGILYLTLQMLLRRSKLVLCMRDWEIAMAAVSPPTTEATLKTDEQQEARSRSTDADAGLANAEAEALPDPSAPPNGAANSGQTKVAGAVAAVRPAPSSPLGVDASSAQSHVADSLSSSDSASSSPKTVNETATHSKEPVTMTEGSAALPTSPPMEHIVDLLEQCAEMTYLLSQFLFVATRPGSEMDAGKYLLPPLVAHCVFEVGVTHFTVLHAAWLLFGDDAAPSSEEQREADEGASEPRAPSPNGEAGCDAPPQQPPKLAGGGAADGDAVAAGETGTGTGTRTVPPRSTAAACSGKALLGLRHARRCLERQNAQWSYFDGWMRVLQTFELLAWREQLE
ncbi:hypothetical protein DFJ73DRAFT_965071 [Zopfochytrium polystomum]|nr:hypothetical protein DFJ73DRAFT_965071 [Zopfochytrium polystomum]